MARLDATAVGNGVRFLSQGGREQLPDAANVVLLPLP